MFELPNLDELQEKLSQAHADAAKKPRFTGEIDALLKSWFSDARPGFSVVTKSYKHRLARLNELGANLERRLRFWNYWKLSKELERVRSARGRILAKWRKLHDERESAFALYSTGQRHAAATVIAESKVVESFVNGTNALAHRLAEARRLIAPQIAKHGSATLGIRWRSSRLSGQPPYAYDAFEQEVEAVSAFARDALPGRVSQAELAREVDEILLGTLELSPDNYVDGSQFPRFCEATAATLQSALHTRTPVAAGSPAAALSESLQDAVAPSNFRQVSAWLVFWTAMAANLRYYDKTYGSLTSENISGATWCEEWEHRVSCWDRDICSAFGLTKDSIHVIRGNFQNLVSETNTGADTLLALSVQEKGRTQVRLAFIQFKRESGSGRTINVWQDGLRQFDNLTRMHEPATGSSSMYALLTSRHSGLAAVPAVDAPHARGAIYSALGRRQRDDSSYWTKADCKVDWQEHGQSFCTLLMHALCGDGPGSFASAQEAFDWMSDMTTLDPAQVPRYMIFQAVGENAYANAVALQREATRWVQSLGLRREGGPSQGMSPGMSQGR